MCKRRQRCSPGDDGFGSSGLRGGSGGDLGPEHVLRLLLVPVQEENHGTAGP